MKAFNTFILVAGISATAQAQFVVTNPISDVLFEVAHVEDIAKTVEMINNQGSHRGQVLILDKIGKRDKLGKCPEAFALNTLERFIT